MKQLLTATRILIEDKRIPKILKWGAAFGLLPIPGPMDEAILIVVGVILWIFYKDQLREAWNSV